MSKRVLVNYLGRKGGGTVYSYEMTKALIESGCTVHVILPATIDNLAEWKKLDIQDLYLIDTYNNSISFIMGTIRLLLKETHSIRHHFARIEFDSVYVPMIQPWTRLVNKAIKKKKTVVTIHDPTPHQGFFSSLLDLLYRSAVRQADEIVILSNTFKEQTSIKYGIKPEKVTVIPHGVFDYYSRFATTKRIDRTSRLNFLFFGRIAHYKGLHILAEAYRKLAAITNDVSLVIAGSGDFSEYRDEYSELPNVTVINEFIPDGEVASYFRGEKIVTIIPYTGATQSGVIPIAMKEKSLLLVSNTGALREQTNDGQCAIMFEPNATDLFKAMNDVYLNYDQYLPLIHDAQMYVESLSWDKLAQKLITIL